MVAEAKVGGGKEIRDKEGKGSAFDRGTRRVSARLLAIVCHLRGQIGRQKNGRQGWAFGCDRVKGRLARKKQERSVETRSKRNQRFRHTGAANCSAVG